MQRGKASDFPKEVLELFDGFVHGSITRREFLDRAARYAVGGVTAAGFLEALSPNFAWAQQVKADDARIKAERIDYPSPKGSATMQAYLARPASGTGKRPGVVVIHENRGLSPYIEDVARRLATEGYVALAPDALTPAGGYPGDEDRARDLFARLDSAKTREDFLAACDALKARPECNGKIGAVGFCWGGGMVSFLATRINAAWPAWEEALKANKVRYEMHMYPNTQHGFHNDTTPRYDEAAARLAWSRTLAHFKANLGA